VAVLPHEVLVVQGPAGAGKTSLLLTLAGRMTLLAGRAKVAGLVMPEQSGTVRRQTGFVDCAATRTGTDLRAELRSVLDAHPKVVFVDHVERLASAEDRAALASLLDEVAVGESECAVVLGTDDRSSVSDLIPTNYSYLTLGSVPDLAETSRS
jgi:RND superfamily putative drug exporter